MPRDCKPQLFTHVAIVYGHRNILEKLICSYRKLMQNRDVVKNRDVVQNRDAVQYSQCKGIGIWIYVLLSCQIAKLVGLVNIL